MAADSSAHASAMSVPGVRALAVAFLGIGVVFGGMQVSLAAFTQEIGRPGLNGVLYGTFAAGNMLSGVIYGVVSWRRSPRARLLAAYTGLTLACAPLWAVHSLLPMIPLVLVAGLFIAPTIVTGYSLVDTLVPHTTRTEAFTWLTGSVAFGQAVAVTVAGLLTDQIGLARWFHGAAGRRGTGARGAGGAAWTAGSQTARSGRRGCDRSPSARLGGLTAGNTALLSVVSTQSVRVPGGASADVPVPVHRVQRSP